jgi:hypothetical protein
MTDSEAAVSRISRLVGNLHEDSARVKVNTLVGAKPGSVAVRDSGEAQVVAVAELRVGQGQTKEGRKSSSGSKAEILQKKN